MRNSTSRDILGALLALACATSGGSWTIVSPPPVSAQLNRLAGNDTIAVAVGAGGTILRTENGLAWSASPSPTAKDLLDIALRDGLFVAVGDQGTIATSEDAIHWTVRNSKVLARLDGIAIHGDQLIAVGDSGTILTSTDGRDWTIRNNGAVDALHGVACGDSLCVAVGEAGVAMTSTDAKNWSRRSSGPENTLFSVTWTGSTFVAGGYYLWAYNCYGLLAESVDGSGWKTVFDGGSKEIVNHLIASDSTVTAVGYAGTVLDSKDLATWTRQTAPTTARIRGIASVLGKQVAVGVGGLVLVRDDPTDASSAIRSDPSPPRTGWIRTLTADGNRLRLRLSDGGIGLRVSLHSLDGRGRRLALSTTPVDHGAEASLPDLPSGVYLVRIADEVHEEFRIARLPR